MTIIQCEKNRALHERIAQYAEVLKTQAHLLGAHGLDESDFYDSGLFRGAIEKIRGQFVASMIDKRDFVLRVLSFMQEEEYIRDWQSAGGTNRHDYSVTLNNGRTAIIELKGCLDGNNTNIFERPAQANEFIIWSVCTNPSADPRHNAWSGIHTRLSAEIIAGQKVVDGVIIWDMACATIGRPCPKLQENPERETVVGPHRLPPPCVYLFPGTIPSVRNNPHPDSQTIDEVGLLQAFHECFHGRDAELNHVRFFVEHQGAETLRTTTVMRNGALVKESNPTAIRRS